MLLSFDAKNFYGTVNKNFQLKKLKYRIIVKFIS